MAARVFFDAARSPTDGDVRPSHSESACFWDLSGFPGAHLMDGYYFCRYRDRRRITWRESSSVQRDGLPNESRGCF